MNELLRQAARMQRKIEQAKEELKDKEVTANSAGEKVKVTVTLARRLVKIEVDPEFVKTESLEFTLDAVCAGANAALELAENTMEKELTKWTGGAKIPGAF